MSPIQSLLTEMRGRLGMYIGSTSLTRLAAFLRGYDYALMKLGQGEADTFLEEFRDWIHRRFQPGSQNWEDTILLHSANEGEAIKHFWELLDLFLEEKNEQPQTDGQQAALGVPQARIK